MVFRRICLRIRDQEIQSPLYPIMYRPSFGTLLDRRLRVFRRYFCN